MEIIRYKPGEDKFYIRHNHSSWITEDVDMYKDRIRGRYNGHHTYKEFESVTTPRANDLELRSDYSRYSYEVKALR